MRIRNVVALLLATASWTGAARAQGFTFVHLSDTHVGAAAGLPHTKLVLAEIEKLEPKPRLVVITGDLTEKGEPGERQRFAQAVTEFEKRSAIPVLRAPGNHDARWSALPAGKACDSAGPFPRLVRVGDVGFVALDSALSFEQHGHLGRVQLERARQLMDAEAKQGARDFVLAFHHPPGEGHFLDDEDELAELCARQPVALVLTGHGHAHKSWLQGGVPHVMAIGVMNASFGYRLFRVEADAITGEAVTITEAGRKARRDVVAGRGPFARELAASRPASESTSRSASRSASRGTGAGASHGADHAEGPAGERRVELGVTFLATPLALEDRCVVAAEEGLVVALRPSDLSVLWRRELKGPLWTSPFALGEEVVVADGTPALKRFSRGGEPRGELALPALVTAVGAPDAAGTRLLALADGAIVALDAAGSALRQLAVLPAITRAPPLRLGDAVLVATWDRHLHVLDGGGRERAALLLHASFYNSAATAAPLVLGARSLWFGHDQRLLVCDGTSIVASAKLEGVQPAYSGGVLLDASRALLGSMDGALAIVDLDRMAVERRCAVPGAVFDSTPCVDGDKAWVGTMQGVLSSVDLTRMVPLSRHDLGGYVIADPVLCADRVIAASTTGVVLSARR